MKNYLIALLCLAGILSCKKSNHGHSNSCRLIAVMDTAKSKSFTSTYAYFLAYDSLGRLSVMHQVNDSAKVDYTSLFTYEKNLIIVTPNTPNLATDSIWLNDNGLPYRVTLRQSWIYDAWTYSYDAGGQLQTQIVYENNGVYRTYSIDYLYSGGDLMSRSENSIPGETYTYYADKAATALDNTLNSEYWTFGITITKSAHLVKSYQSGSYQSTISYTFDPDGKISSKTMLDDNGSEKESYVYDCAD